MNILSSLVSARVAAVSKQAALAAIGAAAVSLFSATASAQLAPPKQQVEFGDLDLSKSHDTERLYRRLRTASQEVCSEFANRSGLRMHDLGRQCIDRALTDAVATISNPLLTALHESRNDVKLAQRKTDTPSKS
jgi:UrcA family protein